MLGEFERGGEKRGKKPRKPLAPPRLVCLLRGSEMSGRSSGVEHNLAKVRVVRSNRIARSISAYTPLKSVRIQRVTNVISRKARAESVSYRVGLS